MNPPEEKNASNEDWLPPNHMDSGTTKRKDGRSHLADKRELRWIWKTKAIVAVDLSPGHTGDTSSIDSTLMTAEANLETIHAEHKAIPDQARKVVADNGYHGNQTRTGLQDR